jgi:hypothetical protein
MADDDTEELILEQHRVRRVEAERARRSDLEAEEHTHERRADKAAYLEERLEERAESEERVEDEA